MRKRDDDALAAPNECTELVLRFRKAARHQGGPLRLERELLPGRQRVQKRCALERDRLQSLFGPDGADLVGLPDEVGTAGHGPHEVGGNRNRFVVVAQRRLVQIEAPFDGGIDHGGLEWMQRALGERRERAHLLDLVAPELDANGLAPRRRKHVDQPAAHRKLTALVCTIDALVARERKRLGELLEADTFAGRDPDRLGPRIRRRHRLGQGGRGCSDETSRRENVERAGTLADKVRHRLETGAPVHAAARQHRDALLAEEPGSAFRGVARVLVFRREQDERAVELFMERGEQQREGRLGHARRSRKGLREALQTVALAERPDERMQNRVVHDERPNPAGFGLSMVSA